MATQTTNLNLTKPAYSEDADVAVINSNMDILDGKIGAVGSTSLQAQATANSTSIGKIIPKITTTTNNSGYAIAAGDYFEANGTLYKATAAIPKNSAWSSSATAQGDTVHGALNGAFDTLNSNKTEYKSLVVNTYAYTDISGWDAAYALLPTVFQGACYIWFKNNYTMLALVNKYSNTYGSIIGTLNDKEMPYFYAVKNGNSSLDNLALNSNLNSIYPQLYFGNGKGEHYDTSLTTGIDAIVNSTVSPTSDHDGYFTINNSGANVPFGNRQFIVGWINSDKKYGWAFIYSFDHVGYGVRANSSTFSITDITDLNSKITGSSEFTLTAGTGFSILSEVNNKMGSICAISVRVKATQVFNANSIVLTVPAGYKPVSTTTSLKTQQKRGNNEYNNIGYATIDTNGNLKQTLTSGGAVDDEMEFLFIYNTI